MSQVPQKYILYYIFVIIIPKERLCACQSLFSYDTNLTMQFVKAADYKSTVGTIQKECLGGLVPAKHSLGMPTTRIYTESLRNKSLNECGYFPSNGFELCPTKGFFQNFQNNFKTFSKLSKLSKLSKFSKL